MQLLCRDLEQVIHARLLSAVDSLSCDRVCTSELGKEDSVNSSYSCVGRVCVWEVSTDWLSNEMWHSALCWPDTRFYVMIYLCSAYYRTNYSWAWEQEPQGKTQSLTILPNHHLGLHVVHSENLYSDPWFLLRGAPDPTSAKKDRHVLNLNP